MPPIAPNPLTVSSLSTTSLTLNCANIPGAITYFWEEFINNAWTIIAQTNSNSLPLMGLTPGSQHTYRAYYTIDISFDLLDMFRYSTPSLDYGPPSTSQSWFEFDMIFDSNKFIIYHHSQNSGSIKYRENVDITDLPNSTENLAANLTAYPTIAYDPISSLWYLFGGNGSGYATSNSATGPWSFAGNYTINGAPSVFDNDIARDPITGEWWMVYVFNGSVIGIAKAINFPNSWQHLGTIYDGDWSPAYSTRNPDPSIFFYNDEMYVVSAMCPEAALGTYGEPLGIMMAHLSKITGFIDKAPVAISAPPYTPGFFNSTKGAGSAMFLKTPNDVVGYVYAGASENSGTSGTLGRLEPNLNPFTDDRTELDVVRLDFNTGRELATNILFLYTGDLINGELVISGSPGHAYGWLNTRKHDRFQIELDFTSVSAGDDEYLLYCSNTNSTGTPPLMGIRITANGKIEFVMQENYGIEVYLTSISSVIPNTRMNIEIKKDLNDWELIINNQIEANEVAEINAELSVWGLASTQTRFNVNTRPNFRGIIHKFVWTRLP